MDFAPYISQIIGFYQPQVTLGILIEVFLIVLIGVILAVSPKSSFSLAFEMLYEKMYDTFSSIVGENEKLWIKTFIITLFFVILFSNLFGLFLDFISPMFGVGHDGKFILHHYIYHITSDINFNLALAFSSILLVLGIQFSFLGFHKALYTYFPIFGKGILTIKREGFSRVWVYYIVHSIVKTFDIIISVFIGLIELLGLLAKIFSLSFRLFGNMASGSLLALMIFSFMNYLSTFMGGINFPIGLPLILYAQGFLVAIVQAFVFSLLVSVFVVVGKEEGAEVS